MEENRDDKQNQLIMDFKSTFLSDAGSRVIQRLSKLCNENDPCYVDGNSMGTAYKEGQRSVILHIRKMLSKSVNDNKPIQGKDKK